MPELEKSDVIKNLLNILIDISSRKTSRGHAIVTMDTVMKRLGNRYDFLKHIQINDNRFVEGEESVNVMSDIDSVDSTEMGRALNDIITTMHYSLGDKAGHFFIKELQRNLDDEYNVYMQNIGIDLALLQLEKEVKDLEKTTIKK